MCFLNIAEGFGKFEFFDEKYRDFSNFAVSAVCLSERAQKMLQNELLDVKKFAELVENEPLQIPLLHCCGVYMRPLITSRNMLFQKNIVFFSATLQ